MPRRWETILCRLRIGHTRLTHGFLMSGGRQPYCDDCRVPLTVKHIIIQCPKFRSLRNRFLADCRGAHGSFILSQVLGENVNFNDSGIFKFIEEARLVHFI